MNCGLSDDFEHLFNKSSHGKEIFDVNCCEIAVVASSPLVKILG